MVVAGGWSPTSRQPRGTEWISQAGQASPACSVVPKFVWGHAGPSLCHVDRQHGLDCRELVAGEVSDQLLGAAPGGHDLKTYPGPLLGAQGWHTAGEGHKPVLMRDSQTSGWLCPCGLKSCSGWGWARSPLPQLPLAAALGHRAPPAPGPISKGSGVP